ncbi:hypothetical protein B9Z55_022604 [Caenorhabditis nigoni]|uniref:Uncharacterized protein n=1 Tax=Caenorhabditis nigoni TaxID=1611254 RepID=A0A2G5SLP1_9PELO|nr:hypothetical protein B9Z55_022604 [Caenorhabditis nigoni]
MNRDERKEKKKKLIVLPHESKNVGYGQEEKRKTQISNGWGKEVTITKNTNNGNNEFEKLKKVEWCHLPYFFIQRCQEVSRE